MGGCEHACFNTEGSFTCDCQPGYLLAADGSGCSGESMHYYFAACAFFVYQLATMVHLQKKLHCPPPPPPYTHVHTSCMPL